MEYSIRIESSMSTGTGRPQRLTRAEQRARTRAALIEAAGKVIAQRGFHGASIEAITAEAGYTGGAFYSNFESKNELFAALLNERVFQMWRDLLAEGAEPTRPTAREFGEISARLNDHPDAQWIIQLWLELMANAPRDEGFREIAAGLWRQTRGFGAALMAAAYKEAGREPPLPPEELMTAMIALENGLSLQHYADPEAVPVDLFPKVFALLFGPLEPDR
jgi:AcrR family transcriptional regulator